MSRPLVYRRYGGSLQVSIPSFEVLTEAIRIPETQWLATACPLEGLNCDRRFLEFVDADKNGRIRVAELRAAVEHTAKLLKSHQGTDAASDVLMLDALSEEGAKLRDVAGILLETLKAPERTRISLEQVRASEKALREAGQNGDGIVAPAFLPEPLRPLAVKMMASFPEVKNRAGQAGVDVPMLQRFREERRAVLAHLSGKESVLVWGGQSVERARRIQEVRPVLDTYFLQCRLVAAQPEAIASLKLEAGRLQGTLGDTEAFARVVSELPVAPPEPGGALRWSRLYRGPAFEKLDAFKRDVAVPITGDMATLADATWRELCTKADAILAWQARLDASPLHGLVDALAAIPEPELDALEAASRADLALKDKLDAVDELERLILYQRWLLTFANNFISMPDLYQTKRRALMEKGTLILGGRRYRLSVLVTNRAAHAALTGQGTTCTLYVQVLAKEGGESYEVAVPVTRGRSGNLVVGKRGVFYDVEGREYDAVVTQIIRQPVSLWEAMTMPFERIGQFISKKIEGMAAAGEKALDESLEKSYTHGTGVATTAVTAPATPAPATPAASPAPPAPAAGPGGFIAATGIAFAAVGTSLAFIVAQVKSLTLLDVISAAIIVTAAVMLPSGLLGWLKLRKRNLALLLEGSGWALNDRLNLTRELAALVTRRPRLPKHATVDRTDALRSVLVKVREDDEEERRSPGVWVGIVLAILLALLWQFREPLAREACMRQWLPASMCDALLSPGASPATPPATTPAQPKP
ncbi:kinesin [Vitiosangium sp. GDMCC 1.1324]|uniref:kinesin n=1 Tax=Vitiosangium sp. (strain GDMCC 1.1324) TaxID=2138576 RepID=UPI000D3D54A6|nr:kinesin [Vitiosangium sp. GDMCC 1.1324]PTL79468.1 kinesin [Vitiosangium sp. GDMCC 1.1324]